MNRKLLTLFSLAGIFGLSACGERPQIVEYKQGKYQGKADTRPWDGPAFKGDKLAWENALRNRNQSQNEYKRVD
jgi:hypothetical protein